MTAIARLRPIELATRLLPTLALAAGIALPATGQAALIVRDIGYTIAADGSYDLDLNQDSATDFVVSNWGAGYAKVAGKESSTDLVSQTTSVEPYASKLDVGATVDAQWFDGTKASEHWWAWLFYFSAGNWATVGDHGYVGLRVRNGSDYNYGWLEITHGSLTLGRVGYETTPNLGAEIPAPAPLALIAAGLVGLAVRRRRPGGSPLG